MFIIWIGRRKEGVFFKSELEIKRNIWILVIRDLSLYGGGGGWGVENKFSKVVWGYVKGMI